VRCGNQNKMDDTKTYDIRKHIPWRYILSFLYIFSSIDFFSIIFIFHIFLKRWIFNTFLLLSYINVKFNNSMTLLMIFVVNIINSKLFDLEHKMEFWSRILLTSIMLFLISISSNDKTFYLKFMCLLALKKAYTLSK